MGEAHSNHSADEKQKQKNNPKIRIQEATWETTVQILGKYKKV